MFENSFYSKTEHIIIACIYVLLTVVAILGCLLVWILVLRRRRSEKLSAINYLFLNLSLSDMVASISVYPYVFIDNAGTVSSSPKQASLVCMLIMGISPFFIASASSLFTICAISWNRFVILRYPTKLNLRLAGRGVVIVSLITWLFAVICIVPGMVSFKYNPRYRYCERDWKSISGVSYKYAILFIGLLLPLTFILLSYWAILKKSREYVTSQEGNIDSNIVAQRRRTRMRRAERTLGQLVLVFVVCWMPFSVYWGITVSSSYLKKPPADRYRYNLRLLRITMIFCTLNSALNPFVSIFGCSGLQQEAETFVRIVAKLVTCNRYKKNAVGPGPGLVI
eukprot:gene14147-15624_t